MCWTITCERWLEKKQSGSCNAGTKSLSRHFTTLIFVHINRQPVNLGPQKAYRNMDTLSQKKPRALTDPTGSGTRETPRASDVSRGTQLVLTATFTTWSHCAKFKVPVADGWLPQTSCKDLVPRGGLWPFPLPCVVQWHWIRLTRLPSVQPRQAHQPYTQTRLLGFVSPHIDNWAPVPMILPQVWVFPPFFFF